MDGADQMRVRDHVLAAERVEQARVAMGIRRPPEWVARTSKAWLRQAGQPCHGCYERIEVGERITIEQDANCAIEARRYRHWHATCHPVRVEREWNALRRQYIRPGGRVAPR